jgi:shikimate kinase
MHTVKGANYIVITDFMASGKTSVARALARRLNLSMIDLDEVVFQRTQRSIAEIIEQHGENYFRLLETSVLKQTLGDKSLNVVALGGGTWVENRNRKLITLQGCTTIWLDVPFELCWQRIKEADPGERPLARNYHQASKLYVERHPTYAQAMIRIGGDNHMTASELADEIAERCKEDR